MKTSTLILPLFADDTPTALPDAHERRRSHVIVETLLACFNNPIVICDRPCSAIPAPVDWLNQQRMQIELERSARLFKVMRRKPLASLDEIRECATTLTNPERAGVLAVISGEQPLNDERYDEYVRAFAHCIDLDTFVGIFGDLSSEPINLNRVEQFYYEFGGRGNWGYLDNEERQWIRAFNARFKARREELRNLKASQAQSEEPNP